MLYWGMFTIGFTIGAVFSFIAFAPKKPESDPEYETSANPLQSANETKPIDSKAIYISNHDVKLIKPIKADSADSFAISSS